MKTTVILGIAAALALPFMAGIAAAGPIERACLASNRQQANRALCGCIQQVADRSLRSGDQRKAAAFFKDPDRAQQVRMSKTDHDNAFWARYKAFGAQAEAFCTG